MVRQLFLLLGAVAAHSWIECSDYLMTSVEDRNYWDASKCYGYPRCSAARNGVFGNEGSLNYQSANGNSCQCAQGSNNAYTSTYPKATYVPGQRVCLAYPAKNHVADHCTNQYIPDNGMTIYRSTVGATVDPALGQWPVQYPNTTNGEHTNGVIDYKGFQNCPKFCENMPNAFCSLCFDWSQTSHSARTRSIGSGSSMPIRPSTFRAGRQTSSSPRRTRRRVSCRHRRRPRNLYRHPERRLHRHPTRASRHRCSQRRRQPMNTVHRGRAATISTASSDYDDPCDVWLLRFKIL
ncbi:hypothetical protein SPRG_12440 [Saprolegnia parasitica CBS 223.65]|uniref:Secreted protein n=1 Tax=Saprolegnia parasitica (strain CBS 223.65) TaxID=695850 RepID=A0A067BT43_SAPPC|nr:hypothetical protein SPRG_12440 [Saprolegnia parasitica CBS 223.65]KDO21433.1 hypothetical protein SPRG_12440 [Saprolegnia parasitica CBS 223.65]|eukprot:XP_012207880.1 hypothetical protein SPRG_12440 [Saprolegnia parasitica CBS 223.65]